MAHSGARRRRTANATAAAESYAPKPNGSAFTYGAIAASSLLAVTFLAGGYFGVDVAANSWPLGGLAVLAFVAGGVLRFWRQKEHAQAVRREYDLRTPQADPAPVSPASFDPAAPLAAPPEEPHIVTFKLPFTLPGLERLYPPGSYRVWERREPLDVSWDAFAITNTIMLTDGTTVEALDVKPGDLAAALLRDRESSEGG